MDSVVGRFVLIIRGVPGKQRKMPAIARGNEQFDLPQQGGFENTSGMTVDELEDLVLDNRPLQRRSAIRAEALRNFDVYEKMILKLKEIRARKINRIK